jgi:DNA primase
MRFGVGFAPVGWDHLTTHLRGRGFTDKELLTGGLAVEGRRGLYDRFRGRLVWPIRDLGGEVVGFGARRLLDDDEGPKYLNTPETPLYKKSQVLYGVDLAKREIARQQRAVIVEGYTDVMACHLSGVDTAVATCGTAFGPDHIKVLRRLLMDQNEFRGEVIFCFDGDEAGRKAARKAYSDDQRFVAQTFVAVEPSGLDPCDLRLQEGPEAVRDLVGRRVPLFEFAIRSMLAEHDLNTAEGRISALRAAAPAVAGIRDRSLRPEYTRLLAGWLGVDVAPVSDEVRRALEAQRGSRGASPGGPATSPAPASPAAAGPTLPPQGYPDPAVQVEREALKLALQSPGMVGPVFDDVDERAFTVPAFAEVRAVIAAAGGIAGGATGDAWIAKVRDAAPDDRVRGHVTALAVEPPRTGDEADENRYVTSIIARLREMDATRRVVDVKGRLQRINPVEQVDEYNRLFGELLALEQLRRALREQAIGEL